MLVSLFAQFQFLNFEFMFNALIVYREKLENPYLARFRSDFGEFRVYVIVLTNRMFLFTFQNCFLAGGVLF